MKKILVTIIFAFVLLSCNKSDIGETVNILDGSDTNISIGEKGVNISTGSGDNINSIVAGEEGVDIKTTGKTGKQNNVSVGANGVEVNNSGEKKNSVNINSTGGVKVNADSGVSTEEVDSLLKEIDKMIDNK